MSFFEESRRDHRELALSQSEFSEPILLAQAAKLRSAGFSVTALVLDVLVKRMRVGGDKAVAEFFACLDEDLLEEEKIDIYSKYH